MSAVPPASQRSVERGTVGNHRGGWRHAANTASPANTTRAPRPTDARLNTTNATARTAVAARRDVGSPVKRSSLPTATTPNAAPHSSTSWYTVGTAARNSTTLPAPTPNTNQPASVRSAVVAGWSPRRVYLTCSTTSPVAITSSTNAASIMTPARRPSRSTTMNGSRRRAGTSPKYV